MDDATAAYNRMPPAWMDFFMMAGVFVLVLISALIWLFFFRKTRKRRRKYRQHHKYRLPNITLAQTGGLPPVRREEKSPGPPPSTPEL
jgi:heme/copper-type cytochrome/quinol oxidase subunit 2